jgi:zinc protease
MSAPAATRPAVPEVEAELRLGELATAELPGRLQAWAIRRSSVPLVELRLVWPLPLAATRAPGALAVLDESVLGGTARRDRAELAGAVQRLGGHLSVEVGRDRAVLRAGSLADELPALLDLIREVLSEATYPEEVVTGDRRRVAEEILVARSQPQVLAAEALHRRLYPRHPYGQGMPSPGAVRRVRAEELRALHQAIFAQPGARLVVVGDQAPAEALDRVAQALGPWLDQLAGRPAPALPEPLGPPPPGPLVLVRRPGAVQSTIRLGGPAPRRTEEGWAATVLANLAFGGLFSSRLVENLRERRGYTYSPRSSVEHRLAGSRFVVALDVATEVTGPALVEVAYELGRAASLGFSEKEVVDARRYALGSLLLATATGSGLAGYLAGLALEGLDPGYPERHVAALRAAEPEAVRAAARRLLAPAGLRTVVLGDPAVAEELAALGPLSVTNR